MSHNRIRIGIVGAGKNTRAKHIPGLRAMEDVEIISVANSTRESSERAAEELGIPKAYDNWLDLISADDTDAIVIGTWPNMHCAITLAALECHKHVLCEARMAANAGEAHAMLGAAQARPDLTTQVVPAPHTLELDDMIIDLIAGGTLGDILQVDLNVFAGDFIDPYAPMMWRYDGDLSGVNLMSVGIWYEAMMRWVGPAKRVTAQTAVNVKTRTNPEGRRNIVRVPDQANILAELAGGGLATMRFSTVFGHGPATEAWIYGTEGTLLIDPGARKLFIGRREEDALHAIDIPADKRGGWRVEEDFINAIRGVTPVTRTPFIDGVRYMEFTEAIHQSAAGGHGVDL
jgi:predicted dehydrogenase